MEILRGIVKTLGVIIISNEIPSQIKKIELPHGLKNTLVFSLYDFINNPYLSNSKKEVIEEFEKLTKEISSLLGDKPSSAQRETIWKIGKMILNFRKKIKKKYNIYITNLIEAFAESLNLSDSFVRRIVKFSEFSLKRQIDENIPWSVYMEALNLPNKKEFYRCIQLIQEGKLKTSKEVREYVKEINKSRRIRGDTKNR